MGAKQLLRLGRMFGWEIPLAVEAGLGLIIAGVAFIFISLIVERVQDARREREEAQEP